MTTLSSVQYYPKDPADDTVPGFGKPWHLLDHTPSLAALRCEAFHVTQRDHTPECVQPITVRTMELGHHEAECGFCEWWDSQTTEEVAT